MTAPPSHFEQLGGADGIRALVDRFYDLMDTAPEAQHIRALHARELRQSRDRLTWFLSGWTGGPPLFIEHRGQPMLRARHLPFPIASRERDEWLWCMNTALDAHAMPDDLRAFLKGRFAALADHMRNRPDDVVFPDDAPAQRAD